METIKNYLDNMFAGLPKTDQMKEIKLNILSNMEDKYNELKAQGKTENEAIGIVISEFGNIDELINELGIQQNKESADLKTLTKVEATSYLAAKKRSGILIGIGVFLCILGANFLITFSTFNNTNLSGFHINLINADLLGLILLLVLVAIAVGLFIFTGTQLEKYEYIEKGVKLPHHVEEDINRKYEEFTPKFTLSLIIGVGLCILSPLAIFISDLMGYYNNLGVTILLFIVSIAVFLFIYFGSIKDSYSILLRIGDYAKVNEKDNKVIGAVAAIVWPLAVIIFLFCGFVYNLWHIAWIVFPITGLLFAMFSSAYSILKGNER